MTPTLHILALLPIIGQHLQVLAVATTPDAARIKADLTRILPNISVALTDSASYPIEFRQRWTIYPKSKPSFSVAVQPSSNQDVQTIVQYASAHNVPFLATGGGHGYSTSLSKVQNALQIDMSDFNTVTVDAVHNTLTVGGGVQFDNIFDPLFEAGKSIQTGVCSQPGMVGVTMGGGIGPLTGEHGLVLDALLSADMVTAAGTVVTASATKNPDLFWGLRGAGFNYGIVTRATYRIYDGTADGNVFNADMSFPGELNGTIFQVFKTFEKHQDSKMSISLFSQIQNGAPTISVSSIYYGSHTAGLAAIKPFLDLGPVFSNISSVPYNQLVHVANFGSDALASLKNQQGDLFGFNLNALNVSALVDAYNAIMGFALDNPAWSGTWLQIEKYSLQTTASIPLSSTAYPWRNAIAYGQFSIGAAPNTTVADSSVPDAFVRRQRTKLTTASGNPQEDVYVNYARGDERPEQMYSAQNLPRLRQLKARWDPKNLFRWYNPIL